MSRQNDKDRNVGIVGAMIFAAVAIVMLGYGLFQIDGMTLKDAALTIGGAYLFYVVMSH